MDITGRVLLSLVLLLLLVLGFLHTEWGQNMIVRKVTQRLSRDLQTHIAINNVEIGFFNRLNLEGVLVEDRKQDTLVYAGALTVRITDWFFMRDKAELKYIGLENAVIKLQRTDSVWNYQFLADYFASPGSSGPKKQSGIELDLKEVELRNVSFLQRDAWVGRDMTVKVGVLNLDANKLSLTQQEIDINQLELVRPYFALFDYDGSRPDSLKPRKSKTTVDGPVNADGWKFQARSISLKDGVFRSDQDSLRATHDFFDGAHLAFRKINGTIEGARLTGDTLRARIDLGTRERSGFTVNKLNADFRLHPGLMEFANLELRTPKSQLGNYFAMRYPSIGSMNDFIHAVKMDANFRNSSIHSDDLAHFAPDLRTWDRQIRISGKATGTVDDIAATNVVATAGNNTFFAGDFSLVGLPDINTTFINVEANQLRTTYSEALTFVPSLRSVTTPNLRQLQFLRFNGNFTGFINDFVTFGTIQTALGTIVSDLNMKLPAGKTPVYSGSLSTSGFKLGALLNDPNLGRLSFAGNVKGRGFDWRSLNANIDGSIRSLEYKGYNFQNITAKGLIANRTLDGNFVIKDPNADLQLKGLVDLGSKIPVFRADARIEYANLRRLGLTPQDLVLKGNFDLNFRGSNLNNFVGSARITEASLLRDGQPLPFDSLTLTAGVQNGIKTLRASSNELEADISGRFDLASLPDAFTLFLNRYYPSYIRPPRRQLPAQSFSFRITTGTIEDYVKLLEPNFTGFNNSEISGRLDLDSNILQVRTDIPQAGFRQYAFSNVALNADGNLDRLMVFGEIDNAIVSDSLNFPHTTFSITAANDTSAVNINTVANQTINSASLAAQVQTFEDGVKVLLQPSQFVINGKTWTADQGGELDFRRNTMVNGSVVLRETDQEIRLTTQPSGIGNWTDLAINLTRVNLGDLSPLLIKQNRVEGLLSGEILVEDPQNRLNVITSLRTEALRLDNDSIGTVVAAIGYNNGSGLLSGTVDSENPEQNVAVELSLDLKDSTNEHRDRISVKAKEYPVKILERFIGGLFSDLQGTTTGQLDILGEGAGRNYVGRATLHNAGLKVNFTQVFYKLDDTEIFLRENEIDFGTMKLRDSLGNTATMRGKIEHEGFQNMVFDIEVRTDNKPMVLLNTTFANNETFYGRAMGTGSFVLTGRQDDMFMNIDMVASDEDSSYITLPPSESRESGIADFMVERKYGREMTEDELRGTATNLTYQVNLTANPLVNIEVILDELTGDIIKGRGTGTLFISAGTTEPLNIRGRYDIVEGSYLFTFQSFFKKPFTIRPGGNNYIEWTGDPYAANIRFDAVYRAEKVSFAPLVQSGLVGNSNVNLSGYRGDVNIIATLTGELFRPNFTFKLELPGNLTTVDPSVSYAMQQIEKNPNELNKQVTYLIVFNSFAPFENGTNSGGQFNELAYNTISGLFFGEVNKRLNQLLSKVINNNDLTFNFSGSLYNRDFVNASRNFNINQGDVNLSVGKGFFDNRFIITFGSTLNVPLQSTLQQTVQYLPDVTAEWLINETGTIRATFFYRQNLDFFGVSGGGGGIRTTRTGASISYRKEFDSLKEFLFGKRKGRLKPQATVDSVPAGTAAGQQ